MAELEADAGEYRLVVQKAASLRAEGVDGCPNPLSVLKSEVFKTHPTWYVKGFDRPELFPLTAEGREKCLVIQGERIYVMHEGSWKEVRKAEGKPAGAPEVPASKESSPPPSSSPEGEEKKE